MNFNAVFYSEIDALDAAGLANATRGREDGYYGVQECRIPACEVSDEIPLKRAAALRVKGSAQTRLSPRSRMLN
jgi:hypothetical protein